MKEYPKEVISGDLTVSLKIDSALWSKVELLSQKLGKPFNKSFLVRKWIYEGFQKDSKEE